ncbi:MAG: hypothetical protein WC205_18975 [Opitutaceae bacterium]
MKRLSLPCLLLGMLAVFVAPVWAATSPAPAAKTEPASAADKSPFGAISKTVATVTGVAISPLLGTGALGIYQNLKAKTPEEKAALPWYAQWSFILPALAIVGICAAKDSIGAMLPPGMKKPLDVLETIENKASGLVAAGAVVPFTMEALSKMIVSQAHTAPVIESTGLAFIHIGAIDGAWFLNLLTVPFGVAVFVLVWMASHAINVLILLSPWGAIDAALKGARTALLGLVTLSATINPWISAALSLIIIVTAYLVAGWAFRLTIFGTVFSWEFFTGAKHRFKPAEKENKVFSSNQLTKLGVPMRTYGRLISEPENGRITFAYKPWMVLPEKTVTVPLSTPSIGKGLFFSTIRDADRTAFVLPPRYRGHEEEIVHIYRLEGGVQDAGLLKAWGTLRELFGGSAAKAQVV